VKKVWDLTYTCASTQLGGETLDCSGLVGCHEVNQRAPFESLRTTDEFAFGLSWSISGKIEVWMYRLPQNTHQTLF
jgi:hypothetical protein